MADAANAPAPSSIRLQGALAPATVVGASTTACQRVYIGGATVVTVVHEASSITSTPDIDVHAMLADTDFREDSTGTRRVVDKPTQQQITTTEQSIDYTTDGEDFIEVEVTSAGGESATVDHIDVFTKKA